MSSRSVSRRALLAACVCAACFVVAADAYTNSFSAATWLGESTQGGLAAAPTAAAESSSSTPRADAAPDQQLGVAEALHEASAGAGTQELGLRGRRRPAADADPLAAQPAGADAAGMPQRRHSRPTSKLPAATPAAPASSPCPGLPPLGRPLREFEPVVPDLAGRSELTLPDVARDVLAAERAGKGRKIIAMSVYGPNQRYWQGIIDNAALAMRSWPGWTLRIYYGPNTPERPLRLAVAMGAELVKVERAIHTVAGTFYRYFALEDRSATRIIFRDIDARLTARDRDAVKEWMESDHYFHTMQDHYFHLEPIMGGMWGAVGGFVNPLLIRRWREEDANGTRTYTQGADQDWLRTVVWPLVRNNTLNHSSFNCKRFGNESAEWRGFPSRRVNERDFVGNTRIPFNNFDGDLPYGVCPTECRRKGKEKEWPQC